MSLWPLVLSQIPGSSPHRSTGFGTHRDLTWPCTSWCWKWRGALLIDLLTAGRESVSCWEVTYWPPLLKPLHLHQETFFFFPGALKCSKKGRCGAGLCLPSQLLGSCETSTEGLSLPSGPQVQDQRTWQSSVYQAALCLYRRCWVARTVDLRKAGTCLLGTAPAKLSFSSLLQGASSWWLSSRPCPPSPTHLTKVAVL